MILRKLAQMMFNLIHGRSQSGVRRTWKGKECGLPVPQFVSSSQQTPTCLIQSSCSLDSQQVHELQNTTSSQCNLERPDKKQPLPAIYSGIGLGVYQGEIVVFRLMAVGEKRWVLSKLQFEDLHLFSSDIESEVFLELYLLQLYRTQSELVKRGLQTKGGIELMKSYCPQADNLGKLLSNEYDRNNPATVKQQLSTKQQNRYYPECLISHKCPYATKCSISIDK